MATPHRTPFALPGADGGPLRGDVRRQPGANGPVVLICHGFKGFKDWGFFPVLADRLARAGFTTVSFNFSGSGIGPEGDRFTEPDRLHHWTFSRDLEDLRIVTDAHADARPILFGHSRGGGAAVVFAAERPVRALVTWNPIGRALRWGAATVKKWRAEGRLPIEDRRTGVTFTLGTDVLDDLAAHRERFDLSARAREVTAPWLNVVGTADIVVPPDEGEWGGKPETLGIEGAGHTFGAVHPWAGSTPHLDRAMDATMEFLVKV